MATNEDEDEVVVHDERPPEWDTATLDGDLAAAQAAGGFTDDPDMADPDDVIGDVADEELTDGTDGDVSARARRWLEANT